MKQSPIILLLLVSHTLIAQGPDSLFNTTDSLAPTGRPVKIFNTQKAINANTTEVVGKGKMEFKVAHNFGDIAGNAGGVTRFFGLDGAQDIRIGFEIGLGEKFDLILSRARGVFPVQQMAEFGIKYQLIRQMENDPSHPITAAIFSNAVVIMQEAASIDSTETSYRSLADRMSYTVQMIIAHKMGEVSVQLNPTVVTRGYCLPNDQKTLFALGGALRFPMIKNVHLIMDYFHTFRSQASKDSLKKKSNFTFFDPLGIGFEIKVGNHNFNLNFTNATELLENRFIPKTVKTWTKGEFRWGFMISRTFILWKEKPKLKTPK